MSDDGKIGVASRRKLDLLAIAPVVRVQDEQPVAETTGGVDRLAVEAAGKARGDEGRLALGKIDYLVAVEITVGEAEFVNDIVFAAAREEPFAARARSKGHKRSFGTITLETMRRVVTSTTTIACGP